MAMCSHPIFVQSVGGIVPCGQCHHCRQNKRRKKTTRMLLESYNHEDALFVTLTYSDKYLPREIYHPVTGEILCSHPTGCLDKRAVQLFLKRVRKQLPPRSLRYFVAGEYGEKRGRPHYHFVLWGLSYDRRDVIYNSWCDPHTGELMCDPDYLDVQQPRSTWDVSQYCCSYIMKAMTKPDDPRLDGRPPEFSSSSKGVGRLAVDQLVQTMKTPSAQAYIQLHGDIPRSFIVNGKSFPIDRYLREKILHALGIHEPAKKIGYQKYKEEMQALYDRAAVSSSLAPRSIDDLDILNSESMRRVKIAMQDQHALESSQKRKNAERRSELYNPKKGDL